MKPIEAETVNCLRSNTKVTEVNVPVFVYRLFHEDFSPIVGANFFLMIGEKSP